MQVNRRLLGCVFAALLTAVDFGAWAQKVEPQQSKSGPVPPAGVIPPQVSDAKAITSLTGVPAYLWRHGCGPTAVGMVIGYWDGKGPDLIAGSAATQTAAVTQTIASGGDSANPNPAGSEAHYEDYASPEDSADNILADDYITDNRSPHADNCIADFMDTSRSTDGNPYGQSWSNDIEPAFKDYVAFRSTAWATATAQYVVGAWFGGLTFEVLQTEIDNGRPMVFLVDSDGDGSTDHFVTVIGYNPAPPQTYICFDTWSQDPREEQFREMSSSYSWGVWGGWSFQVKSITVSAPNGGEVWVPGTSHAITWSSTNLAGNVRVYLYSHWTKMRALGDAPISDNGAIWNIPTGESPGLNYRIRVQSLATSPVSDYSDKTFIIGPPPSITLTNPNGGEIWPAGTTQTISWTPVSLTGNAAIYLYNNWAKLSILATVPLTAGSWSWPIAANEPLGTTYRIRVQSLSNTAISDYSNDIFAIGAQPSITVTSPNGGETWQGGTSHPITWTATRVPGNVRIQLYNNWTRLGNLVDIPAANGIWTWPISPDQALGSTYRIRVQSLSTSANDYGNGLFTIFESSWTVNPANGHFYKLTPYMTWEEARVQAENWGGYLTTINDQAENDWLALNFAHGRGGVHIGLSDVAEEGTFLWVNGETSAYRNWAPGEPNNAGDEDYCLMWGETNPYGQPMGMWNDGTGLPDPGIVERDTQPSS